MARILLNPHAVKGFAAALLVIVARMATAGSIDLQSAFPSDTAGNPVSVEFGKPFYMTAKFHVSGPLAGPYRVSFALPYQTRITSDMSYSGDAWATWGPYTDFLETPTAMQVSILSSTDTVGDPLSVSINPSLPTTAIEYFSPQPLSGSVGATADLSSGTASGLTWFTPAPVSGGFQQVLSSYQAGTKLTSTPFGQTVVSLSKVGAVSEQFTTIASSCRSNPALLRAASFSSYKSLPSNVSVWLRSETLAESTSGDISTFVSKSLPKNFKASMKPYDAVQHLFQAVVAKMHYVAVDAKPDAIIACRTGKGDCGFFSALFVAACRNIGIPARAVCGMTVGTNQWHVWAEFYIPGSGWIPSDPTYCDALSPNGAYPLYFGTIPDLNQRVATTYGFDHIVSGHAFPRLQSPGAWVTGSTKVRAIQPFCNLAVSNGP